MSYPSRQVADLARWAKRHGCEYLGVAKSGHVKFALPNGQTYTTGASPSDVNSAKNAQRDICKALGIPFESGKRKGRIRKGEQRARFSMEAAIRERRPGPSVYTVGARPREEAVPIELRRLRAEKARLEAEIDRDSRAELIVALRDVDTRIMRGIY